MSTLGWVENRPTAGRRALDWRELWRYRELVWFLAARDVKVRYKQAALGAFWAILYLRRRSSVAPIVSHAGFNALEILRVSLTS